MLDDPIVSYGVEVEFVNWPETTNPEVSTAKNGAYVEYGNPCDTPTMFSATAQTDPLENTFSGDVRFELN